MSESYPLTASVSKHADAFAELLPFTGLGDAPDTTRLYTEAESKEWWYVFVLQFLLWWSLWCSFDSISETLGAATWNHFTRLHLYLAEVALGGIVYFVPLPQSSSDPATKLKRFGGMVLICCGLWNLLDSLASAIASYSGLPALFIYASVLLLTATLGGIHHYKYQENYLIDRLM